MASLQLIKKFSKPSRIFYCNTNTASIRIFSSKKDGNSSSEEEKNKVKDPKPKNEKTTSRLNLLLQEMMKSEVNTKEKLHLARPKDRRLNKQTVTESTKTEPVDQQIIKAVKNVAESIGGDKKQTESELLFKLLDNKAEEGENLTASISDIVKGMKIDRETKPTENVSRSHQVKQILEMADNRKKPERQQPKKHKRKQEALMPSEYIPTDLFGSKPLGILKGPFEDEKEEMNKTWNKLQQRELKLAVVHPPANYFQEMILWTDQGKLWKFPIDNEYELEEEKKVYFAEHIFLEKHLEPWCPDKGPIRHFMELVCVGLSKNPYMTVQDKKEHIEWYKTYFEDKKKLLEEVGAIPAGHFDKPQEISPN